MDVAQLKAKIIDNPELIQDILEHLELFKIRELANEFRCARYEDANPTGVCIKKDNLYYFYRGRDGESEGDIIKMIQDFKHVGFPEAIKIICEAIGVDYNGISKTKTQTNLPFSGYFKGCQQISDEFEELNTYPEDILDKYFKYPNTRFQRDGISLKVQQEFGVCYDLESDRICVPWRDSYGRIVGVMGRYNGDDCDEKGIAKWFPLLRFSKSKVLFGFSENYNYMLNNIIFIGESEKFPMQLRSMEHFVCDKNGELIKYEGINAGVAVGSHSISEIQIRLIQSCFPKQIIVCFDEDVPREHLIETCKKLQYQNSFYKAKVGYLFDEQNKYIPKDSKMSPSDKGKEIFQNLLNECLYWVE